MIGDVHLPTTAPHRPTASTRSPWFVSPAVDTLVVGLGSIVVYLVFRAAPSWSTSERVVTIGATLVWAVNYPHFASTNYRLYHDRANIAQYPMTALLVPVLITAAMIGSFASPAVIAPAFVMLYQLWSPYHFSGQTIGITMLYARRHEYHLDGWLRRALSTFVVATFVLQAARFEVGDGTAAFFGVTYPTLGLPTWAPGVVAAGMWACAAGFVVLLVHRVRSTRQMMPPLVLLPAITQFVWFAATPPGYYLYLVPFFHSLQYLLIAWNLQLKETLDRGAHPPSVRFVLRASARWAAIIVAGGYVMFWLLPRLGAHAGRSMAFSSAIVLAGLQMHHFFVDGVIWRLRNPSVRNPLSSSIPELLGRRSAGGTS